MVLRIGVPYDARSSAYTSFDGKYRYVSNLSPFLAVHALADIL
jgi:hypothetical protein